MVTAVRGSSSLEIAPISTTSNAQKEVFRLKLKEILIYLDGNGLTNFSYVNGAMFKLLIPKVRSIMNRTIKAFIEDVKRGLSEKEIEQFHRCIDENTFLIRSGKERARGDHYDFAFRKLIATLKIFDFDDEQGGILKRVYPFAELIIITARLYRQSDFSRGQLFQFDYRESVKNKSRNRIIMEALTLPMLKDRQLQLGKICCGLLVKGEFEKVKRILTIIDRREIRGVIKEACKFCMIYKRNELITEIFCCSLTEEDERAQILYEVASELIRDYKKELCESYEARIKVYEKRIERDGQYIDMGIDIDEEYIKIYEEAIVDFARDKMYKMVDTAIEIAKLDDCRLWRERIYRDAHEAFWSAQDYERASNVGQLISQTESV
jgi:hypothetical protein